MEPWLQPGTVAYARLLSESLARLTGMQIPVGAQALFDYPLPLVSHGTGADPIFRYGNRAALALWEMSALPEPGIQADRSQNLARALEQGFITDYAGLRVAKSGKTFRISETVLWNVTNLAGRRHGQAALIGRVEPER
jgi:hypothetical protein